MKYIILYLSLLGGIMLHTGRNFRDPDSGQEKTKYIYVGVEACAAKCHNNDTMGYAYDKWKTSGHAKSFEDLKTKKAFAFAEQAGVRDNPWDNILCLKCHVTAAGLDASSLASTYKLEDGVTCEACHKGELVTKTFIPKETDCLTCHNGSVHSVSAFNFQEGCLKISHPRPKSKQG